MRRWLARLSPFVVTVALLGLLVRQVDRADLRSLLAEASLGWLLVGVGLYVVVNLLRAARYGVLIRSRRLSPRALVPVSYVVSLLNNALPLRGGELGFVALLRRRFQIPVAEGSAALLMTRVLDYLAVTALFVTLVGRSLQQLPATVDWPVAGVSTSGLVAGMAVLLTAGALLALALAGLGRRAVGVAAAVLAGLRLTGRSGVRPALGFVERVVDALERVSDRRVYGAASALSLLIWLVTFAWLYAFARGVGQDVGFGLFVVAATFQVLSKALPLPTVGGLGAAETGWALGFAVIGRPAGPAIASGLAVSMLTLLVSGVFGLGALLVLRDAVRLPVDQMPTEAHG